MLLVGVLGIVWSACRSSRNFTFPCTASTCIPISKQCDGHFDCTDASDEALCPTRPPPAYLDVETPGVSVHAKDTCLRAVEAHGGVSVIALADKWMYSDGATTYSVCCLSRSIAASGGPPLLVVGLKPRSKDEWNDLAQKHIGTHFLTDGDLQANPDLAANLMGAVYWTQWLVLLEALEQLHPDKVVLVSDAFDVLFHVRSWEAVAQTYCEMLTARMELSSLSEEPVIVGADDVCYPWWAPGRKHYYFRELNLSVGGRQLSGQAACSVWTRDMRMGLKHPLRREALAYPNTGLLMGKVSQVARFLRRALQFVKQGIHDDQALSFLVALQYPGTLIIDSQHRLMANLAVLNDTVQRVFDSLSTSTDPVVGTVGKTTMSLHCNGNAKRLYSKILKKVLGKEARPNNASRCLVMDVDYRSMRSPSSAQMSCSCWPLSLCTTPLRS
mmetsp:Transcript_49910/g.108981  ORF Transcript_49910/g.108981 Transcript_49910/m.108981 type:complete len:442 (-) Transcript_49910:26-1351(-)